jgi:hypothetical protein
MSTKDKVKPEYILTAEGLERARGDRTPQVA